VGEKINFRIDVTVGAEEQAVKLVGARGLEKVVEVVVNGVEDKVVKEAKIRRKIQHHPEDR
jgi:hypothetical protein